MLFIASSLVYINDPWYTYNCSVACDPYRLLIERSPEDPSNKWNCPAMGVPTIDIESVDEAESISIIHH